MSRNRDLMELEENIRVVTGPGDHPLQRPPVSTVPGGKLERAVSGGNVSVDVGLINELEAWLAGLVDSEMCVVTSSGTSALHLALLALGVGPGDIVICPAVSFAATANAILYCGAFPAFVDIDPDDLGISPHLVEARIMELQELGSHRLAAICVVSVFGLAPKVGELMKIANKFGLPLLLDGAGALGTESDGSSLLSQAHVSITSFNGNKIITGGAGGAIFTNSSTVADTARHLSLVGKVPHAYKYEHDCLGFNYRMPALNAALLLDQLNSFDSILSMKRELRRSYDVAFKSSKHALVGGDQVSTANNWLNTLSLDVTKFTAPEACDFLNSRGLGVRPLWEPLPNMPYLTAFATGMHFPVAADAAKRMLSLPSSVECAGAQ